MAPGVRPVPSELARALRALRPALAAVEDARVELLALLWGPRFDREQALQLAGRLPSGAAAVLHAAADRFDRLDGRRQQRLRRLAAGSPRACATIAHAPHPAD